MERTYLISELAAEASVNVETIRYYQRRGLFPLPTRRAGVRRYGSADAERLRFIKRAQRLRFTLAEIKDLLSLLSPMSCRKTRQIAALKLAHVDNRLREMREMRDEFARLLRECDANVDDTRCPLIETLCAPKSLLPTNG